VRRLTAANLGGVLVGTGPAASAFTTKTGTIVWTLKLGKRSALRASRKNHGEKRKEGSSAADHAHEAGGRKSLSLRDQTRGGQKEPNHESTGQRGGVNEDFALPLSARNVKDQVRHDGEGGWSRTAIVSRTLFSPEDSGTKERPTKGQNSKIALKEGRTTRTLERAPRSRTSEEN